MLGQMSVKYFKYAGYDVITLKNRYEPATRINFIEEIQQHPNSIVINAIGRIKQKSDDTNDLLWANAILPLDLAKDLLSSQILIHPSTDCVFAGDKGKPYNVDDKQDATDDYGWSKQLGEAAVVNRAKTLIVRVSIIGIDNNPNPKGLLGWFISQPANANLKGFSNHFWNGITTLEWCKIVEQQFNLIDKSSYPFAKIIQPSTPEFHTKCQMLDLFNEVFAKNHLIEPLNCVQAVDRRLQGTIMANNLKEQLFELKLFMSHD